MAVCVCILSAVCIPIMQNRKLQPDNKLETQLATGTDESHTETTTDETELRTESNAITDKDMYVTPRKRQKEAPNPNFSPHIQTDEFLDSKAIKETFMEIVHDTSKQIIKVTSNPTVTANFKSKVFVAVPKKNIHLEKNIQRVKVIRAIMAKSTTAKSSDIYKTESNDRSTAMKSSLIKQTNMINFKNLYHFTNASQINVQKKAIVHFKYDFVHILRYIN